MPDACFADPRLAEVYDALEEPRDDLACYVAIAAELGARSLLDVGCGTGSFALLAAAMGLAVTAVDPAGASLQVARAKPGADRVRWLGGTAASVPALGADLCTMTANVAMVFLDDDDWRSTLGAIARAVRPGGHLVFETRDPARRAWDAWTPSATSLRIDHATAGPVVYEVEVREVSLPYVSFRQTYRFERDGAVLHSDSTLRFRDLPEIRDSLVQSGWELVEVRDAPDRPGLEWVVVARRSRP